MHDLLGIIDVLEPLVLLMLRGQVLSLPGWKILSWVEDVIQRIELYQKEIMKPIPSSKVAPLLNKHTKDLNNMKFKSIDLVEGLLVEDEVPGRPINWRMRSIEDSKSDLAGTASDILKELKNRKSQYIPEVLISLDNCLNFAKMFISMTGSRVGSSSTYKKSVLFNYRKEELKEVVEFVAELPYVKQEAAETGLEIDPEGSDLIFWKAKETFAKVIWGEMALYSPMFFKKIENGKQIEWKINTNERIESFFQSENKFSIQDHFTLRKSNGESFEGVLKEEDILKAIYEHPNIYESLGREFVSSLTLCLQKLGLKPLQRVFIV